MDSIKTFLAGKKTYLTAFAGVLTALVAWADGTAGLVTTVGAILGFVGLGSLRAAIAKLDA